MADDTELIINEWRGRWVPQHVRHSRQGLEFWNGVADLLIEGRQALRNNPLVPIGRYALQWPGAFEFLVERNNRGIALEQQAEIEAALIIYELSVADEFSGTHPYDRLRIVYTKREWYEDALRVCTAYVSKPVKQQYPKAKTHFEHHAQRIDDKVARRKRSVSSLS
jgi:hypothetical protein